MKQEIEIDSISRGIELFTSQISVIDKKQYFEVYKDVMKKLDRLENEYLPQVTLDKTEVFYFNSQFPLFNNVHLLMKDFC